MVTLEPRVRTVHLECRKNSGTPPSSGGAEKGDGCSGGRFVRTAPLPPHIEAQNYSLTRMILGFFFLFHFLEVLSGREGFFAKNGGVSLVRNRDLRPAAKANPTVQQAFERFQKYNRLKNLSQGSLDFYAAKGRSFFRFLGDTEQPITTITEETVEDYTHRRVLLLALGGFGAPVWLLPGALLPAPVPAISTKRYAPECSRKTPCQTPRGWLKIRKGTLTQ